MPNKKPVYKSGGGVLGIIVMAVALILEALGLVEVSAEEQSMIAEHLTELIGVVGALIVAVDRIWNRKHGGGLKCIGLLLLVGLLVFGGVGCGSLGDNVLGGEAVNETTTYQKDGTKVVQKVTDSHGFINAQLQQNLAMILNQKPTFVMEAKDDENITLGGVKKFAVYNSQLTPAQIRQLKTWYDRLINGNGLSNLIGGVANIVQAQGNVDIAKEMFRAGVSKTVVRDVSITPSNGSGGGFNVGTGTSTGTGSQPTTNTDDHHRIITNEPAEGE